MKLIRYVHVCVDGSSMFERMKRKKNKEWKKKSTVKHEEVGSLEKIVFVIFDIFLKQSEKE